MSEIVVDVKVKRLTSMNVTVLEWKEKKNKILNSNYVSLYFVYIHKQLKYVW